MQVKIVFVDLQYDYGVKARGRNIIGQDGFLNSFERLGHSVKPFYYDAYLPHNLVQLQVDLIAFIDNEVPDLVFFSLFQNQFKIETLEYLKSKYVTVNWFGDDTWRFDSFTSRYANSFTYCVTTDKFSLFKYRQLEQYNVIYSQWAAIDSHTIPLTTHYEYDVTFVGGFHPYRKWFIDILIKRGINVQAFGHGWANGSVSAEVMNEIFRKSKINLNLSNSNSLDLRYLLSHWKAVPLLLRSKKNMSQIKARNFEIPYFGGFQLTDYVPTIETYFELGKEIVCYKDVDEAELLIRYYLENDDEREAIKHQAHQRALHEHGYIHRLKAVLEHIV